MAANDWALHDSVPPFQGFEAAAAASQWSYSFSLATEFYMFSTTTPAVSSNSRLTLLGVG